MAGQERRNNRQMPDLPGDFPVNGANHSPKNLKRQDALLVLADVTQNSGGLTPDKVINLGRAYYYHLQHPKDSEHPFEPIINFCQPLDLSLERFGVTKYPFLWRSIPVYPPDDFYSLRLQQRLRASSQRSISQTHKTVHALPLELDLKHLEEEGLLETPRVGYQSAYQPTKEGEVRSHVIQNLFRQNWRDIAGNKCWFILNEKGTTVYQGNAKVGLPRWLGNLGEAIEVTLLEERENSHQYLPKVRGRLRLRRMIGTLIEPPSLHS